ncbi:Trifunctional purine biosynthetic protein adenosine-3 [Portunus trituberculatus]|uniref:phosphoribosylformylglycinamidine cyclo-ligase n=1 Tax=Portunus trituberculatus TaxID=210409 RepID=A0A5B7EMW1_PORTR|nr:Trifunctional purine biosynthetic protein adenosine-3 [Portunus trituberculatus]
MCGCPSGAELLTPTRIYCRSLAKVLEGGLVKAAAHITGGGLLENLPRVLPSQLSAHLQASQWPLHPVFGWLAAHGISVPMAWQNELIASHPVLLQAVMCQ